MPNLQRQLTIGRLAFRRFHAQGWDGWLNDAWADATELQDIDAWLDDPGQDIVLEALCRTVARRSIKGHGIVYSKLMRAQNDGVFTKNELFSKFKWKFYPSRAKCILKITARMLDMGHHCPIPVLGIRRKRLAELPTDLFVSTELTDPTVEERLKNATDDGERRELLAICGRELARFHADGFIHGDFLPRNTCLSMDNATLSYLDNDRTRHWPRTPFFHFQRRNLTQFCFNLYVLAQSDSPELPEAFIDAYAAAASWPEQRLKDEKRMIFAQNARRWSATASRELKAARAASAKTTH